MKVTQNPMHLLSELRKDGTTEFMAFPREDDYRLTVYARWRGLLEYMKTWHETTEADLRELQEAGHITLSVVQDRRVFHARLLEQVDTHSGSLEQLHPKIITHCAPLLAAKQYDLAVFAAFKAVEDQLRQRIGAPNDQVGQSLVTAALSPNAPRLRLAQVAAEQEAAHSLFRGAIGFFKNPHSHRFVSQLSVAEVAESLAVASLLLRLLEKAEE